MRHLEVYATKPHRLDGDVTALDFLGYLIESHLHETYILRARIQAFAKFLERTYRKTRGNRRISACANRIHRGAERVLRDSVAVRSEHVHLKRLRVPDVERVEFMREFGRQAPEELKPKFDRAYKSAYRELRRQRLNQMREVNDECSHLLDFVAANTLSVLLRRNLTEFVFPADLAKKSSDERSVRNKARG